jgi:hypothetical protein
VGQTKLSQKNKSNIYNKMNSKEVLSEIRHLLFGDEEKKEVAMATAELTDGTIIEWEGELAVGTTVFVQTGEGLIPAPDATHEVTGGMLVTTEEGVVTEIVEPEVEAKEEEEMSEDVPAEFASLEAFNSLVSRFEEAVEKLNSLEEKLTNNEEAFSTMREAFGKTVDLVEKVADLPSEEPTKEPAKLSKKEERFANIANIAKQLKNK